MKQTSEVVKYHLDTQGVATVSLNRPDKHNAFDDVLIAELTEIFNQVAKDPKTRAMVLRAEGKSFCAGADLNWMQRMADYSYEQNLADANALARMLRALYTLPKPTIARVQGAAYGGAVGLVACCDIAIGSRLSKFCLSEVKLGLIPATISPYVIEAMGARVAKRYFMTAEVFSARRARRLGLLAESVTEEELDETVQTLLEHVLKNGPQAVSAAKQLVAEVKGRAIADDLLADTSVRIANIRISEEGQEGIAAFLQKRKPAWRQDKQS